MSTLILWHNRFNENKSEAVEAHISRHWDLRTKKPGHQDSKTKKARHCDSRTKTPPHRETAETTKPWHRDSKAFFQSTKCKTSRFQEWKNHDIEIPRPKSTTLSFCRFLTHKPLIEILHLTMVFRGIGLSKLFHLIFSW